METNWEKSRSRLERGFAFLRVMAYLAVAACVVGAVASVINGNVGMAVVNVLCGVVCWAIANVKIFVSFRDDEGGRIHWSTEDAKKLRRFRRAMRDRRL